MPLDAAFTLVLAQTDAAKAAKLSASGAVAYLKFHTVSP